jgi:hypothetical protein
MNHTLVNLQATRKNILKVMDGLTEPQLTHIPSGYNNHLFWNACHVLVTQQLLVYKLSGLDMHIEGAFVDRYRKGSFPSTEIDFQKDKDYLERYFLLTIDQLDADINNEVFQNYQTYPTSYGITLHDINEAIMFNNMHESMHLGYMLAMKRLL